jgi:hypothetical protein
VVDPASLVDIDPDGTTITTGSPCAAKHICMYDQEELPDGTLNPSIRFIYFVKAEFSNNGKSGASNFTQEISAVDNAPNPGPDSYKIKQNATLTVPTTINPILPGVLGTSGQAGYDTDSDSPYSPPSASILRVVVPASQPFRTQHGYVTFNSDRLGGFTYIPDNGFSGTDQFTYQVNDGNWSRTVNGVKPLLSDVATGNVTITVGKK